MRSEEHLFEYETQLLEYYKDFLDEPAADHKRALEKLTSGYSELLEQAKFITKVSDRLEKKLENANTVLFERNQELQHTLSELKKARIGKKAVAIIYSIAIVLFVFEEFFVEPFITMFEQSPWFGVIIKLGIILLLKPAEHLLESFMLQSRKSKPNHVTVIEQIYNS